MLFVWWAPKRWRPNTWPFRWQIYPNSNLQVQPFVKINWLIAKRPNVIVVVNELTEWFYPGRSTLENENVSDAHYCKILGAPSFTLRQLNDFIQHVLSNQIPLTFMVNLGKGSQSNDSHGRTLAPIVFKNCMLKPLATCPGSS